MYESAGFNLDPSKMIGARHMDENHTMKSNRCVSLSKVFGKTRELFFPVLCEFNDAEYTVPTPYNTRNANRRDIIIAGRKNEHARAQKKNGKIEIIIEV